MTKSELTLGPVLYNWSPERWRDFYFEIADEAPIDNVCIGEVVCQKRAPFFEPVLADVVARLENAGKKVIHSALTLIMSAQDQKLARSLTGSDDVFVEANDVSEVSDLRGRPFAIGPFVNVYNEGTLDYLSGQGATRICLPAELPLDAVTAITASSAIKVEVQAFGRTPLAISARCYHARAHNKQKAGCEYVCALDDDGMVVDTMDGKPFLIVNGTQTQSYTCLNLVNELGALEEVGVGAFRLHPQSIDMVGVSNVFRGVLDRKVETGSAMEALEDLWSDSPFSNGFLMGQEGVKMVLEAE
jgi:O2-independent ubiquinone biosynthesis protein UbiV